jgi:hypothetical protein
METRKQPTPRGESLSVDPRALLLKLYYGQTDSSMLFTRAAQGVPSSLLVLNRSTILLPFFRFSGFSACKMFVISAAATFVISAAAAFHSQPKSESTASSESVSCWKWLAGH